MKSESEKVKASPFVKLFVTPNARYALDVNKNRIMPLTEKSAEYLESQLTRPSAVKPPAEIQKLQDQGYFGNECAVGDIIHPASSSLGTFLARKVQKITLQLTQNCNFRCRYCIYTLGDSERQRPHTEKKMSWATAKRAIDFFWEHSVDSKQVNIGLYGGEPLLAFPMLKRVVRYAKKRFSGKDISFSITCNGTLLTKEIIRYLSKNRVNMMISLDGPKEINDLNRVFANGLGTFDVVMEKVALLKELEPDYARNMQISMVMDPQNDFDCINTVFLDQNELQNLNVQATLIDHTYDDQVNTVSEAYYAKYAYQLFLAYLSYFQRFPREKVSPIALRALDSIPRDLEMIGKGASLQHSDAPSGPCVPGQMRPFVDVDGNLFPCERVSETSRAMRIGDVYTGYDLEKALAVLNIAEITSDECKNCWAFRYCMQCAKKADSGMEGFDPEIRLSNCDESRAYAATSILQWLMVQEVPIYYPDQIGRKLRN